MANKHMRKYSTSQRLICSAPGKPRATLPGHDAEVPPECASWLLVLRGGPPRQALSSVVSQAWVLPIPPCSGGPVKVSRV